MLRTAIEIVDNRLPVEKANYLTNKYESIMNVAWIVIDDIENPVLENRTYYAKRFLLNEGNGKNLVITDYDCNRVKQYRCDFNDYRLYKNWISNRNIIFKKEIKKIQQEKIERNKQKNMKKN